MTKTQQTVQASTSNAAGGTTTSSSFTTNTSVSGVATITNGGTGPTVGCDFVIQVSNDGGTTWYEWSRQTQSNLAASAVNTFPFALSLGNGADFANYRLVFTGNTVQAVTVKADASSTTV